jgi:hypothetical protein
MTDDPLRMASLPGPNSAYRRIYLVAEQELEGEFPIVLPTVVIEQSATIPSPDRADEKERHHSTIQAQPLGPVPERPLSFAEEQMRQALLAALRCATLLAER